MDRSRLAIIIPALNEAATIGSVVEKTLASGEVVVVDDGSTDGTSAVAESAGATVVIHTRNRGYDAALNSGFAVANDAGREFAITFDGDGQHDPSFLRIFKSHLASGTELVLGVRPRTARLAESIFATTTNWLYGVRDPLCGLKGYQMQLYRDLGCFDDYGSIGTHLALFAVRRGCKFVQVEVPIAERDGNPRFGRILRANWRIMRAMMLGFTHAPRSQPRSNFP